MKRILFISMLALFPLCSSAQYDGGFGVGLLHCPMLGATVDQCGRSCDTFYAGKPCDVSEPTASQLQCFSDCKYGFVVVGIGNLHGYCETKCKISMPNTEDSNLFGGIGNPFPKNQ